MSLRHAPASNSCLRAVTKPLATKTRIENTKWKNGLMQVILCYIRTETDCKVMRASTSRLSFSSRDPLWNRMPDQISVSEFLSETTEDYNSPTTSSFTTRLQSCRNTISVLEEPKSRPSDAKRSL
ncbi:hypothetical protein AMELA_G00223900 [Ameiurus melas]|uniref:Uncharacterized protein n=1 Tax=Ameiurus melas TaxID=219545 RepID=A0A7J6A1S3_AMEME|nr:hypothetical protein AMELA_G00223900 [Ameiurus melas]